MDIKRETDATLANQLSNDPACVSNVSYDGRIIDWSPVVNQAVILSNGEDGVQVWELKERHVWEVMTIFGPTCRGKKALETGRAMGDYMRPYIDIAFGSIPDRLPAAKWFYRQLGARPVDKVETRHHVYEANPGESLYQFRVNHG